MNLRGLPVMSNAAFNYWVRRWRRQSQISGSESGLTLLECIVALVMMSVVAVAITPPLFLATASRVQSNRAEQAIQVAQGEVDKVRVTMERGDFSNNLSLLPQESSSGASEFEKTPAPSGVPDLKNLESTRNSCDKGVPFVGALELRPVDVDGDCLPDFAVQTFRSAASDKTAIEGAAGLVPVAFRLGVRVWAYQPIRSGTQPLDIQAASLQLTSGTGEQGIKPLAVLYTQLAVSDTKGAYEKMCYLLNGGAEDCKTKTSGGETP